MSTNEQARYTVEQDRELLELAAKAWGIPKGYENNADFMDGLLSGRNAWNPLTDDGDALRLAVKLMMEVRCLNGCAYAEPFNGCDGQIWEHGQDVAAATRRAIVRAAAALAQGEKA